MLKPTFVIMESEMDIKRRTLTVEEAGRVLGISRGSAYEGVRNGTIPSIRIGHRLLIPVAGLERLLSEPGHSTQGDDVAELRPSSHRPSPE